jgi:histidine triad (HIT) family protein
MCWAFCYRTIKKCRFAFSSYSFMTPVDPAAPPELLPELQRLTDGLLFRSESEAPLQVVTCAQPSGQLTNAALLQTLGEPADSLCQVISLAYFLRNHTAATQDPQGRPIAERYQALQAFMEQHLRAVQVYRIGSEPKLTAYALGEAAPGQLAGFKTVLIET